MPKVTHSHPPSARAHARILGALKSVANIRRTGCHQASEISEEKEGCSCPAPEGEKESLRRPQGPPAPARVASAIALPCGVERTLANPVRKPAGASRGTTTRPQKKNKRD